MGIQEMNRPQNYINHVTLVLDASSSMQKHSSKLVEVVDAQIAYLAQRSKELDQETRVTVYTFSYSKEIHCLVYDKDVLRMPSIKGLYRPSGMTALVDATLLSLSDLQLTPQKYGEHAFLFYVLTDGMENNSNGTPASLKRAMDSLPDHWTVGVLVPNKNAVFDVQHFGFAPNNIELWDANTAQGITEGANKIRQATDNFMVGRTTGQRGTSNLFKLATVSESDIASKLVALTKGSFNVYEVLKDSRIDEFVTAQQRSPYKIGRGYYQLTKRETIQMNKDIAIQHPNGTVYAGAEARKLLGLPDGQSVRVTPGAHSYRIYVQSTAPNRKLLAGTSVLVMR
jgi:hypothetical protein